MKKYTMKYTKLLKLNRLTFDQLLLVMQSIDHFRVEDMELNTFEASAASFLFVTPSLSQLIKLSEDDAIGILDRAKVERCHLMFFVVNDQGLGKGDGNHWSLLVFWKADQAFLSFDSMNNRNAMATQMLVEKLKKPFRCPSETFRTANTLQQTNGKDCGLHTLFETGKR